MAKLYKVEKLDGALLDAAVAKAEGLDATIVPPGNCFANFGGILRLFKPTKLWQEGGPIIAREHIASYFQHDAWVAGYEIEAREGRYWGEMTGSDPSTIEFDGATGTGPTPLIAAMRAYVTSKLGAEVEL